MTGIGATKVACGAFSPIWWSQQDTPDTIRQVVGHNAAYRATCEKGD